MKVFLPKVEITLWNLGVRVSCLVEEGAASFFVFATFLTYFLVLFPQNGTNLWNMCVSMIICCKEILKLLAKLRNAIRARGGII